MKRIPILIIFLFFSALITGQNQAYYVKQTQMSKDLKNYNPLETNPILSKVVLKENGIAFYASPTKYTFIEYSNIDRANDEDGGYRYETKLGGIDIGLFYTPYPYVNSTPELTMALVAMEGLVESNPKIITFFRLIFKEDLVMR